MEETKYHLSFCVSQCKLFLRKISLLKTSIAIFGIFLVTTAMSSPIPNSLLLDAETLTYNSIEECALNHSDDFNVDSESECVIENSSSAMMTECPVYNTEPGFTVDFLSNNTGWIDYDLGSNFKIEFPTDSTMRISGFIENGTPVDFGSGINGAACGLDDGWNLVINLSDKMTWAEFQATGGIANVNSNCSGWEADQEFWDFSGSLTGTGCNIGRTIIINGPTFFHRFQIGIGGNSNDATCAFGMSTWMLLDEGGTSYTADLYAFMDQTCYPTEELSTEECYFISDGSGLGYETPDTLFSFNYVTGAVTPIGPTYTHRIESMAMDTITKNVYTSNKDTFGIIDLSTGAFSAINNDMGTLNGADGIIHINDVDGKTFDHVNSIIWATERRVSSTDVDGSPDDLLFQIDPISGAVIQDAFGVGVGYLIVDTPENDLDDIAISEDGTLYAISNFGGSGNQAFGTIDKVTGVWTEIGDYGIEDVESLAFTATGQLVATTGKEGVLKNTLFTIDAGTGLATQVGPLDPGTDVEACDCISTKLTNLQIGDKVFADIDGDGVQDIDEPGVKNVTVNLLTDTGAPFLNSSSVATTTTTDANGIYSFDGLPEGQFIVEFVLPGGGASFTTQNAGSDDNLDSDVNTTTGRSHIITLANSTNDLSIDAGLLNADVVVRDCDDVDELFVADNGGVIKRYNSTTGVFIDDFISDLNGPIDMVVGSDDWLYVSSSNDNEVKKYSLITGVLIETISGILDDPQGMTLGPDGNIYVNNDDQDQVVKIDIATGATTVFVTSAAGGLDGNKGGIEFGPDGNLYVTSFYTDEVLRYDGTTGAFIDVFAPTQN